VRYALLLIAIGCGDPAPVDAGPEPMDAGRDAGGDGGSDAGRPRTRAFSLEWANVIESGQTLGVLADSRVAAQPDDGIVVSVSLGGAAATFSPDTPEETELGAAPNAVTQTLAWYGPDGTLELAREVVVADPVMGGFTASGYGLASTSDGAVFVSGRFMAGARFGGEDIRATIFETNRETVEDPPMVFTTYTSEEGYLARLDPEIRELQFARRARSDNAYAHFVIHDVSALDDGSTIVIGSYDQPVTLGQFEANETRFVPISATELFIARLDPDGALQWARHALGPAEPRRVEVLPDGSSIVLVRFSDSLTLGPGETDEVTLPAPSAGVLASDAIVRFDPDGALEWARYVTSDATMYPGLRDLIVQDDGSVIVAGTFRGEVNWPGTAQTPLFLYGVEGVLARIAADGTLTWQERIQPVHSLSLQAVTRAADGFWAAVTVNPRGATFIPEGGDPFELPETTTDTRLVLLRYDDGGVLRGAHLAGENEIGADDMLTLASGDLVIVGRYGAGTVIEPGTEDERTLPDAAAFRNTMVLRYSPLAP
jgi:hypothetical protein